MDTPAGRTLVAHDHPLYGGPLGIIGSASGNALAAEADVVLAVGTRLQDFSTASWTVFNPQMTLVADSAGFGHLIPPGFGHLIPLGIGHPVPRVLATL